MLAAFLALVVALGCATPQVARQAQDPPASDLLNAVLWMQRSVECKASAFTAFALARIRLDQALADPTWTGAPQEQTEAYHGSFESAPFGHDFKLSDGERRRLKRAVLDAWPGP